VNSYDTYIPANQVIVKFSKWFFGSLIDHDKDHILWQYRWQGLSCFAIIESILYPGCERLQYIVLTEIM
jgi:hypothetical protein